MQIPRSDPDDKSKDSLGELGVSAVKNDVDVFRRLVNAGRRLAEIHVHYEQQPEYPLTRTEKAGQKLDYRVAKMRLSKDKSTVVHPCRTRQGS